MIEKWNNHYFQEKTPEEISEWNNDIEEIRNKLSQIYDKSKNYPKDIQSRVAFIYDVSKRMLLDEKGKLIDSDNDNIK